MRSFAVVFSSLFVACVACVAPLACGGAPRPQGGVPTPTENGAQTRASAVDAGEPDPPFAASAQEATQLISDAIDTKTDAIAKCIKDYRQRKHLAHERVEISVGVGQDGRVLGVTLPKGKKDEQLPACVLDALRSAVFPRSHAGIITMTKAYQEVVQ